MQNSFLKDLLTDPTGLVIFNFAGREYCIDIKYVVAILNPNDESASSFSINNENSTVKYQNENIRIIDTAVIFGSKHISNKSSQRLFIILFKGNKMALPTERISEIISLNKKIVDSLCYNPSKTNDYLSGSIEYEGRTIYVLDLNEIIELEKGL